MEFITGEQGRKSEILKGLSEHEAFSQDSKSRHTKCATGPAQMNNL